MHGLYEETDCHQTISNYKNCLICSFFQKYLVFLKPFKQGFKVRVF